MTKNLYQYIKEKMSKMCYTDICIINILENMHMGIYTRINKYSLN